MLITDKKGIQSKEKLRDFQLHAECRIPVDRKVDGQKGGNSGIFLMGPDEGPILVCGEKYQGIPWAEEAQATRQLSQDAS